MLEQNAGLLDQIDLQMYELKQLLDIIVVHEKCRSDHTEDLDFGNACLDMRAIFSCVYPSCYSRHGKGIQHPVA